MSRKYQLEGGYTVEAPDRCCLFCDHCTDIWWDWGGIWGLTCDINDEVEVLKGAEGQCERFVEEADDD